MVVFQERAWKLLIGPTTTHQIYSSPIPPQKWLARESLTGNIFRKYDTAVVVNNHYDTDGVLSVWACLYPIEALKYEKLLVAGAEAGDFGEWSSDDGVKLDCVISEFWDSDEDQAYAKVLDTMPSIMNDFSETHGAAYEKMWAAGFEAAKQGWKDIKTGVISMYRATDKMVVVELPPSSISLSPYALHRGLKEKQLWDGSTRILKVVRTLNGKVRFLYEKIGHGWVSKLKDRHQVPNVDAELLTSKLNQSSEYGLKWNCGGLSGLVSICQTASPTHSNIEDVVALLTRHEKEYAASNRSSN